MEGCKGFRPGSAVLAEAAPECQRSPFAQKGGEIPWSEWSQSTAVQGPHLCPWLAWVCRVKMLGTRATSGKASTPSGTVEHAALEPADRAICRFDCFAHARERLQRLLRVRMEQGPTGCTRFVHRYSNNIRTRLPGIWSGGAAAGQQGTPETSCPTKRDASSGQTFGLLWAGPWRRFPRFLGPISMHLRRRARRGDLSGCISLLITSSLSRVSHQRNLIPSQ